MDLDHSLLGTPQAPSFGLDTFGDLELGPDGALVSQPEAIRQVVAEGVLADSVGLDFFGVGEHHRPDFAISAPDVVLAGDRRAGPSGSGSARRSRCSARTTRSGCSSGSRPSTPSPAAGPR